MTEVTTLVLVEPKPIKEQEIEDELDGNIYEITERKLRDRSILDKVADLRAKEARGEKLGDLEKKFLEVYEGIKKQQDEATEAKIAKEIQKSRDAGETYFISEEEEKKQKEQEEKETNIEEF